MKTTISVLVNGILSEVNDTDFVVQAWQEGKWINLSVKPKHLQAQFIRAKFSNLHKNTRVVKAKDLF
jgi:hypothetical protein